MALVKLGKQKARYTRKKGHVIYKLANGTRVVGSSTVAKIGDDTEGLIHWAWNLGMEGKDYKEIRDESADVGSVSHFMIQAHLEENETDLEEVSPLVIDLATNATIKFMDFFESNRLKFISAETPLVSEKWRYGGTRDILCRDPEERLCLIDNKTGKSFRGYSWFSQLASYEELHNENDSEKIMRRAIFRIGKKEKGDCEERWLPSMDKYFELFKAQLNLYNIRKQVK